MSADLRSAVVSLLSFLARRARTQTANKGGGGGGGGGGGDPVPKHKKDPQTTPPNEEQKWQRFMVMLFVYLYHVFVCYYVLYFL